MKSGRKRITSKRFIFAGFVMLSLTGCLPGRRPEPGPILLDANFENDAINQPPGEDLSGPPLGDELILGTNNSETLTSTRVLPRRDSEDSTKQLLFSKILPRDEPRINELLVFIGNEMPSADELIVTWTNKFDLDDREGPILMWVTVNRGGTSYRSEIKLEGGSFYEHMARIVKDENDDDVEENFWKGAGRIRNGVRHEVLWIINLGEKTSFVSFSGGAFRTLTPHLFSEPSGSTSPSTSLWIRYEDANPSGSQIIIDDVKMQARY